MEVINGQNRNKCYRKNSYKIAAGEVLRSLGCQKKIISHDSSPCHKVLRRVGQAYLAGKKEFTVFSMISNFPEWFIEPDGLPISVKKKNNNLIQKCRIPAFCGCYCLGKKKKNTRVV